VTVIGNPPGKHRRTEPIAVQARGKVELLGAGTNLLS
jgi:hypothetical protein